MLLTIIEFILGSFMHFLYDFYPSFITAIIAPINESIFEHLKLALYPMLIVGLIFLWHYKKMNLKTLTALFFAIMISVISIVLFYYFYRYGLGIESLILDILLLLVSIGLGNYGGYLVYKHQFQLTQQMLIILFSVFILSFTVLTFIHPDLPIFIG